MDLFILLALTVLPLTALRQANSPPCVAQLTLSQTGNLLRVTGNCRSQLSQPARYRYELRTLHQSPSGNSRTTQGGSFELPAQQQVQLSQVGLGAASNDHYHIYLLVFDDNGRAVAQDSASR
jgi:hypothetical protein